MSKPALSRDFYVGLCYVLPAGATLWALIIFLIFK